MKIHVAGPYGYGSFGNDCYVNVLRSMLAGVWPGESILFERVDAQSFSPSEYDLGLLGGGGILYDKVGEAGADNLRHFMRYPASLQWFDKPSFALALGVQGLLESNDLAPYLPTIESLELCTVRDAGSAKILRDCGVRTPVLESADLGYLMPCASRGKSEGVRKGSKPVLGVVASQPEKGIIHPEFPGFEARVLCALEELEARFELRFLSFHPPTDGWLPTAWDKPASSVSYEPVNGSGIEEFVTELAGIDVLLTSRFHGVVLGALMGIPFLALGAPDEKLQRECLALDYPFWVSYGATGEELVSGVEDVWAERESLREQLFCASLRRSQLARRSFDVLGESRQTETSPRSLVKSVELTEHSGRRLIVWAASADFWDEASPMMSTLGSFDCLVSSETDIRHPGIATRIDVPQPGIMNWKAFPEDLRRRLSGEYDSVIVCHSGHERPLASQLGDIAVQASRSGSARTGLELRLWTHALRAIESGTAVATTQSESLSMATA